MLCTVMSKKKASTGLGRSLIKERRRGRSQGGAGDGWVRRTYVCVPMMMFFYCSYIPVNYLMATNGVDLTLHQ